jgi:transposase
MPKISRLEVISSGARRRWTDEEKARIVAESFGGPRRVSATARRYGLSASQLFTWRRQVGAASAASQTAPTFTPAFLACDATEIAIPAAPETKRDPAQSGRMEIALANGRRIVVGADVDSAALTRVLDVLERRA